MDTLALLVTPAGATKVPMGLCVDITELPVIYQWHLDFTFFNMRLICGFIAYLTIIDAMPRMLFEFPYRNKHAPIDVVSDFFALTRKQKMKAENWPNWEEFKKFMRDVLKVTI